MILWVSLLFYIIASSTEIGGKTCSKNVHCGIPAADLEQSRDVTDSLSGQCLKEKCTCYDGFGCKNCGARMILDENSQYTTIRTMLTDPSITVDICSVEWGGGYCSKDEECYGRGLCIENQCVCYHNWLCPYCSMGLNEDILIGAKCGDYVHGGGKCIDDMNCNGQGICLEGYCMCNAGYVCSHCSSLASEVINGKTTCPCENINCGKYGLCQNGQCVCDPGYKGQLCTVNICESLNCGDHGICSNTLGGICLCDDGYTGTRCDTQPSGNGKCKESKDCGNGVGGICNPKTNTCECYKGWTCPMCNKVGAQCNALAQIHGGGNCTKNADCGNFGPDMSNPLKTGGRCEAGICICFEGFTCPQCSTPGKPESVVKGDLKCTDGVTGSVFSFSILLIAILLIQLSM